MKYFYKLALGMSFILSLLLLTSQASKAQLVAGDLLFTGYNAILGAGVGPDTFTFAATVTIPTGTTIHFTERGYQGGAAPGTWQPNGTTEGTLTLVTSVPLIAGDQVMVYGFTAKRGATSIGSVTVFGGNAVTGLSLSNVGDQVIAFRSATNDPAVAGYTMISGITYLPNCGTTTDAGWNGAGCSYGPSSSLIPIGLTGGVDAFLAGTPGSSIANSHARFNPTTAGAPFATVAALKAAIMTKSNWDFGGNGLVTTFPLDPGGTSYSGVCTPPSITTAPSSQALCAGSGTATFSVVASNAVSYQWQEKVGSGAFANINNGGVYSGATTASLSITSPAASLNANQYQVIVTGSCSPTATSAPATLTVSTPGRWLGGTSTAWSNTANWSCAVLPTSSTDVVIPSGTTFSPVIDITTAAANNITINSGATLSYTGTTNALTVNGTLAASGTFNTAGGRVVFAGGSQTIPALTYQNLQMNGAGNKTLAGPITVNGTLTFTNGYILLGNNNLTVASTGAISGGNINSFAVVSGTGSLIQQGIGAGGRTGTIIFPLGISTASYTPLRINNAGTSDDFTGRVIDHVYTAYNASDVPTGTSITSKVVDRTWIIKEALAGGSNVTVTLEWNGGEELSGFLNNSCVLSHYTGGGWKNNGQAFADAGFAPSRLSRSGITSFSPFGIGSSGSPLPVNLLSFSGKRVGNDVNLEWVTADEKNMQSFVLERSYGGTSYERIYKTAAKGTVGQTSKYSYTDPKLAASENTLYRLKMVNLDGSFTYSAMLNIIQNQNSGVNKYSVYPNPFSENKITLSSDGAAEHLTIIVRDMTGNTVYKSGVLDVQKASGTISLDLNLPVGTYIMQLNDRTTTQQIKIIKK